MEKSYFEKISNAVEDILRYNRDIIISLREIYNTLIKEYKYTELSETELIEIIQGDPRFEYMEMPDYFSKLNDSDRSIIEEQRTDIEAMGFYSGPRVKLTRVEIEYEKIIEILNRKVDTMMDILIGLWENRPTGDAHAEDKLLTILAKGQRMQREMKALSENDKIENLIHFIRKASDFS